MASIVPAPADSAARRHIIASVAFLAVGAAFAILASIKLAFPGVFDQAAAMGYSRLRPVSLNLLVWGFGFSFSTAVAYYLTPRLTGRRLWSEWMTTIGFIGSVALVTVGTATVALGVASGADLAEFPLWIDIPLFLLMLIPAVVVSMTTITRTENTIYVSLAFVLAAVWAGPLFFLIGNLPNITGVGTMLQSTFMVGGVLTMWLPATGMAAAYYVVPKETGNALFSRPLAMGGFWTLVFAGTMTGQNRFGGGPNPAWLESTGAVLGLGLLIAAVAIAVNVWNTFGTDWNTARSPALRLTAAGLVFHLVVAAAFALLGFRSVGNVVAFTTWYEGLIIATLLGSTVLMAGGFTYHAFPRLVGRSVFSDEVAARHARLTIWGVGLTAAFLMIAGTLAGLTWISNVTTGAHQNFGVGFVESMGTVRPMYVLAAITSIVAGLGAVVYSLNVYRTYTSGDATAIETLVTVDDGGDDE